MQGHPLFRILLVLLVFSLLGWPVWSMTRQGEAIVPEKAASTALPTTVHIAVSFANAPASFQLEYLGRKICSGSGPQRDFSCDWDVEIPQEGVDLFLLATWPAEIQKTAVRIEVLRDGEKLTDQTFWGEGRVADTVTVPATLP